MEARATEDANVKKLPEIPYGDWVHDRSQRADWHHRIAADGRPESRANRFLSSGGRAEQSGHQGDGEVVGRMQDGRGHPAAQANGHESEAQSGQRDP